MPDPESVATGAAGGITVAGTAKWVWNNWDLIKTRLGELTGWVKKPNDRPILILGPGGCGKTTLLHILAGDRCTTRAPAKSGSLSKTTRTSNSSQLLGSRTENGRTGRTFRPISRPGNTEGSYCSRRSGIIPSGKLRG
jgi:hypothetical protein